MLDINRAAWNRIAAMNKGRTALPCYGPLAPTEDELGLIGDVRGKRVLELGCGSGHSLAWLANRGAAELWGTDLSEKQIEIARQMLAERGVTARLMQGAMETPAGLPENYYDLVVSIYALGWTTDLAATLGLVTRYLKVGGAFVFSWEHPAHACLEKTAAGFVIKRSYSDEGSIEMMRWKDVPIVMHARKLSTFINGLIDAGLTIERLIEGDMREENEADFPHRYYSKERARMMPTTLIVKARKLDERITERKIAEAMQQERPL